MRALLAGILALAQTGLPSLPNLQGPARVIDGDTIEVEDLTVRFEGIDAPERRQSCVKDGQEWSCGKAAADALRTLVSGSQVSCWIKETGAYGRAVAWCEAGGRDIGGEMVKAGWALAYRDNGHGYVGAEDMAKAAGRGIWASEFEAPWEWREKMRDAE